MQPAQRMSAITEEKSSELLTDRYSILSHQKKISLTKEELKVENQVLRGKLQEL